MSDERDWQKTNRIIDRTAATISRALSMMMKDLPRCAAPQMAIELVVRRLAESNDPLQAWLLQLIMEDPDIRESYDAAVATRPATASPLM